MGDAIPFGQPLVSHHRRQADMNYRAGMRVHFEKGVELEDKATIWQRILIEFAGGFPPEYTPGYVLRGILVQKLSENTESRLAGSARLAIEPTEGIYPMSRSELVLLALMFVVIISATTTAATIQVNSAATGSFGQLNNNNSDIGDGLVLGWTFSDAGETITVTSTGLINLFDRTDNPPDLPDNDPDGIAFTVGTVGLDTESFTPLEQSLVDSGALSIPRDSDDTLQNVGALMGAFVSSSLSMDPSFKPRDSSTLDAGSLGIDAGALMLVGTDGFTFVSPGPGGFYFGINDLAPFNNRNITEGGFTVSIVPEPSTFSVFAISIAVISFRRRKSLLNRGVIIEIQTYSRGIRCNEISHSRQKRLM